MFESIQRREFLATAGALSAAAVAQAGPTIAAGGGGDKIIVAVMGTGGRGTGLATSFQREPGVEVAIVCDVDMARAERAAASVQKATGRTPRAVQDYHRIMEDK